MELDVIRWNIIALQPLRRILAVDPIATLQAWNNKLCNLVIRFVACNIINWQKVIPIQELKNMMHEISSAKKVKIPNNIPAPSRMSPNSSAGLYVCDKIRQVVRVVTVNKDTHDKEKGGQKKLRVI